MELKVSIHPTVAAALLSLLRLTLIAVVWCSGHGGWK